MKKLIIICLTLLSSTGFSQPFSATNQVIVNSTNNPPLWGRGFDFTPNVNITLTQLGKRVPSVATYTWNIWRVSTQTLIHSQTSTSTTPGVYTYENISAPVTLLAGVEYCLTLYGDGNAGAQYYYDPSSQINSNLTYNFMRYCNSCSSGVFPTQSLSNYHYGTPDFMFNLACVAPTITCPPSITVNTDPGLCSGTAVFPTTMVLQYNPTGSQVSVTPLVPFFQAPNFTAGTLSQVGYGGWINTDVWPVGQISSSPTPVAGQYITFQVTVPSGTNFDRLQYTKNSYLGNGATSATIRSSLDGFTSDIKTIPVNPAGAQELIFDLRGMPFVSGPITFRIYFYGAPVNNTDWDDLVSTTFGGGGLRLYANNLATVTGTCLPLTISYTNFPSNDQFNLGTTTVTATVTDGNSQSASCNFTVTVTDNQPPSITCPPSITINTDPGLCSGTAVFPTTMVLQYDPTGTQNANIPVAPFFQAPNFTAGSLSQLGQNAAWGNTGVWPVGQISSSPTPVAGQYITFQVTVPSGTNFDRLQYTKNSYLGNGATSATIRSSLDGFTSNIKTIPVNPAGAQELIFDLRGMPFVSGPITFRIYFYGAPVNNGDWDDLISSAFGGGGLRLYANNLATATDNCGPVTISYANFPSNDQFNLGTTTVTATATDGNGNSAPCNFTVTVIDQENPTITCPPNITVNTDPGVCYATNINFGIPLYGDNCTGTTVANNALTQYPSGQFPQGGIVVQWEATDASGNKSSCSQTVAIQDIEPPVALCKNICVYLNSGGTATITGADIDNGSHDNCGIASLTASPSSFSYADAGPNTVTLTVLDVNGNSSTCTATVTVGEYYTLFGAGPSCSTPSGQPDACHVHIGNGNNVSGNVGSYRLVETGGGVVINGNVYSGGKVNYANGVSSKSISAANILGQTGNILSTGNSASITGDVNVAGNIYINQNGGSFVTGTARHPSGTTYSGPVPGGGVLTAPPVLPALPGMPAINAYSCGGTNITTTATLNPGSYGNITLGNAAGVIITFHGPGNYYFSRIDMGQGGIHTFKYDFLGLPGKINIFVCGDIDFGTHMSQWANPNTPDACRVYFESHGTGSTNGTNSTYSVIIALGSQFYGRVWAPYGGIHIGSGSCCTYATGSFWSAKQVQLEGAVTVYRCGSACPPGPRIGQEGTTAENVKDMLHVYPNPTTGQTTVSFFTETPDNFSLKVMDYQGRVVMSNQIKSIAGDNTLEVDMSQFAKGLYMIEVGNADHSQKVKLVVQ